MSEVILIVDDKEDNQVATKTSVFIASKNVGLDYEIEVASSVEEAKEYFSTGGKVPQLIIVDMHLPLRSSGPDPEFSEYAGYQLLKELSITHPKIWWLVVSGQPQLNQIIVENESRSLLSAIHNHSNVIGIWFKTREADLLKILEQFFYFEQSQKNLKEKIEANINVKEEVEDEIYIATSPSSLNIYNKIRMLAIGIKSLIIIGERGVGKELTAKLLHKISVEEMDRTSEIPFEKVDGRVIDFISFNSLIESLNHGTLYIENVDQMSKSLQDDISRNLINLNNYKARIIFGIERHHELFTPSLISTDLYLNSIILPIPSLDSRKDEILVLAKNFLDQINIKFGKQKVFVQENMIVSLLSQCKWENNLDDLMFVIEQTVLTTANPAIGFNDIKECLEQRKLL